MLAELVDRYKKQEQIHVCFPELSNMLPREYTTTNACTDRVVPHNPKSHFVHRNFAGPGWVGASIRQTLCPQVRRLRGASFARRAGQKVSRDFLLRRRLAHREKIRANCDLDSLSWGNRADRSCGCRACRVRCSNLPVLQGGRLENLPRRVQPYVVTLTQARRSNRGENART